MTAAERRLVRHLAWVVVVKFLALAGLWWTFVHEHGATTDANVAAQHLMAAGRASGEPR